MPTARLTDRAVLAAGGPGAVPFLQGLITNAMERLAPGHPLYAALLTPQGKVQFDFILHAEGDTILLDVATAKSADLLQRLKLYRLRAPVTLDERPDLAVFATWDTPTPPHPEEGAEAPVTKDAPPLDPRLAALGQRWIAPDDSLSADTDLNVYTRHRLALGVPDTADVEGEFALDANFEELHGVDFKKGCFVGQEVTARMKHKAQPRRRIVPLGLDAPVERGAKLTDRTGLDIGEITSSAGGHALASVKLDRLRDAETLNVGGQPVTLKHAAYTLPIALPN